MTHLTYVSESVETEVRLSLVWLPWILKQGSSRQLDIRAAQHTTSEGWLSCAPEELFASASQSVLRISQRLSCTGIRTALVHETANGKVEAALFVPRMAEHPEPPAWRSLLLEAVVLSRRYDAREAPDPVTHAAVW